MILENFENFSNSQKVDTRQMKPQMSTINNGKMNKKKVLDQDSNPQFPSSKAND